jgi:hypothetical protein
MKIPRSVIRVVSEELGWHYTHRQINNLFTVAPGDATGVNKVDKCSILLTAINNDGKQDPLTVLGKVLEDYMDYDIPKGYFNINKWEEGRERIVRALAQHGLIYHFRGAITFANAGVAAQSFEEIFTARNLPALDAEFTRTLEAIHKDPPAGLTAACSLLESLFKILIEDERLEMPPSETIKPLWNVVSKQLGLDPTMMPDEDLKRILSGMTFSGGPRPDR